MTLIDKKYYINAGAGGTYKQSGNYYTTPAETENIIKFLDENDIERLIVYFHGGLVSESSGMNSAERMMIQFADASANGKRHVVSFVWETGPVETLLQNLDTLAGKSLFKEAAKFAIKLAAKKLGLKDAKGTGEYLSDETINQERLKSAPFEYLDKDMDGGKGGESLNIDNDDPDNSEFFARLKADSRALISNEGSEEFKYGNIEGSEDSKGFLSIAVTVAKIAFAVLKRYVKQTHHDFYPTIMEETFREIYIADIGNWGWSQMKNKAQKMFDSNDGRTGVNLYTGMHFLTLLDAHTKKRKEQGKKFDIELIGHSAGSIAICNMLTTTAKNFDNLRYNTVFFLAPACRTDLFLETLDKTKDKNVFKSFKLFTMREEKEKEDHCIPFVYTHSLLYLVSGLFEDETDAKILGLHEQFKAQGRYAGFEELNRINAFINSGKLVLSDDIGHLDENMRCNSLKHGDFDNDTYTLTSILKSL